MFFLAREVDEIRAYIQKFQKTQRAAERAMDMYVFIRSSRLALFFGARNKVCARLRVSRLAPFKWVEGPRACQPKLA